MITVDDLPPAVVARAAEILDQRDGERFDWLGPEIAESLRTGEPTITTSRAQRPDETVDLIGSTESDTAPMHEPTAVERFVERIRASALDTTELLALDPPVPLIDGVLYLNSLTQIYGPSGVSKTNTAVGIALSVSHDAWWMGKQVRGGRVLYIAGEGVEGVSMRAEAWHNYHRLRADQQAHGVTWLPWTPFLNDPTQAEGLAQYVAEGDYSLVVVDTLARAIPGAEENAAKDMGVVVAALDRIRTASGACVLLVHHSGKDLSRGGRGSTAVKGALNTEMELTGDPQHLVLKNPKQKDGAEGPDLHLALKVVSISKVDALGNPLTSVVVVPAGQGAVDIDETGALAAVIDALDRVATVDGVPLGVWKGEAVDDQKEVRNDHFKRVSRASFYRNVKTAIECGAVESDETNGTTRYRIVSPGHGGEDE